MADLTTYSKNLLLNGLVRGTGPTLPSNTYVGLFTAAPSDAGGGTEVSGNAYARVQADTAIGAPTDGVAANTSAINFPTPTGSWGTVTHFGLFDASTSGNLLMWDSLSASKAITTDDTVSIAIGDLDITFA